MKKYLLLLLICGFSLSAQASSEDQRLMELLKKKSELNMVGKDLSLSDSSELEKLITQKGLVRVAEMQAELKKTESAQKPNASSSLPAPVATPLLSAKPLPEKKSEATAQNSSIKKDEAPISETSSSVPCSPEDQTCKKIVKLRDSLNEEKAKNTELLKEAKKDSPQNSPIKTDLLETKDMGASVMNEIKKETSKKPDIKKTKAEAPAVDPNFFKRMKKDMAEMDEMKKAISELKPAAKALPIKEKGKGAIYEPLPGDSGVKPNGFYVERDSSTIITKRIGPKDAITIKMCMAYGVSIILDESIDTELQRVILDDKIFFDAQEFENKRGVYVRLLKPIPQGNRWDSAIRLVRKSDDKTYVVNLQAVACPEGQIDYPKVVYLKEKFDVLTSKSQEILTPEDMIIQVSDGLPRKNIHQATIYDMVASPGSDWVVFGIEIVPDQSLKSPEKIEFQALDNLQINKLAVKSEYLKLQSEKASELRSEKAYRFKVMVMIDKAYVFKNRYLHLVYLNKETKHYQYIQVDTLNYFQSLKERGFDL